MNDETTPETEVPVLPDEYANSSLSDPHPTHRLPENATPEQVWAMLRPFVKAFPHVMEMDRYVAGLVEQARDEQDKRGDDFDDGTPAETP